MAPPAGARLLGATAVWPQADKRLHAGQLIFIGPDLKLGVVRVHADGSAAVKFFGGVRETFFEEYAHLRPDGGLHYGGHTVQLVESAPDGRPRPWIRVLCSAARP